MRQSIPSSWKKKSACRCAACLANFRKRTARSCAGYSSTSGTKARSAAHCRWTGNTFACCYTGQSSVSARITFGGLQRKPGAQHHWDSMEHHTALATKASERYLLGEMSEPERFDFEAHYFDCGICADDVRTGAALARGIKAVCTEEAGLRSQITVLPKASRDGWLSWLSLPVLAPSALALAFGCVAAYQAFVIMPGLRWAGYAQAL